MSGNSAGELIICYFTYVWTVLPVTSVVCKFQTFFNRDTHFLTCFIFNFVPFSKISQFHFWAWKRKQSPDFWANFRRFVSLGCFLKLFHKLSLEKTRWLKLVKLNKVMNIQKQDLIINARNDRTNFVRWAKTSHAWDHERKNVFNWTKKTFVQNSTPGSIWRDVKICKTVRCRKYILVISRSRKFIFKISNECNHNLY